MTLPRALLIMCVRSKSNSANRRLSSDERDIGSRYSLTKM